MKVRRNRVTGAGGRAATERKAMPGNRLAYPSPVPAERVPVDGHGLERDSFIPIRYLRTGSRKG
ncbi:MAG: hypothetical protein GX625_16415 [Clostridiaceae bacterium]|nr:hypothetical protein [Clostridiaceae bacterium]